MGKAKARKVRAVDFLVQPTITNLTATEQHHCIRRIRIHHIHHTVVRGGMEAIRRLDTVIIGENTQANKPAST